MQLATAYVRFYKAFNYDYLRKAHPDFEPDPWDVLEDGPAYPYITVPIESKLTCIVGANEAGKSQLLDAIQLALSTETPKPTDLCRYSEFFTVSGEPRVPDVGLHFSQLTDEESVELQEVVGRQGGPAIKSFRMFKVHPRKILLYFDNEEEPLDISDRGDELAKLLPDAVRIEPTYELPDSVPIGVLLPPGAEGSLDIGLDRRDQIEFTKLLLPIIEAVREDDAETTDHTAVIEPLIQQIRKVAPMSERDRKELQQRQALARDLLVEIAGIGPQAISDLQQTSPDGGYGHASAIEAKMNGQLGDALNLAKWWSQDSEFRLKINAHDQQLLLTVRDRTGSQYTFDERSHGLKYFLSYLIQALTHMRSRTGREILLMDEPDAFLSNEGQQDLLRVFAEFTRPIGDAPGAQVIYVTHSPFLIDKNRGDRIRVLAKGDRDEGVRVVKDVGKNHFEPIRTALGGFVGESVFIGNCNLVVEGMADQIYLAGFSEMISQNEEGISAEHLDLNRVTLVPAGGASEVPYHVYLARGRGAEKPALVVLLDGDQAGDDAVRKLRRGGPGNKMLLEDKYIAQLKPSEALEVSSDLEHGALATEDLIPVELGVKAAKAYLTTMKVPYRADLLTPQSVKQHLEDAKGVFEAIESVVEGAIQGSGQDEVSEFRLYKVAFARHVVEECRRGNGDLRAKTLSRFKVLFRSLTSMQREAEYERAQEAITSRIDREVTKFIKDWFSHVTKSDVNTLLERLGYVIDDSVAGEATARAMSQLRVEFNLDVNPNERIKVGDLEGLRVRLMGLKDAGIQESQLESITSTEDESTIVGSGAAAGATNEDEIDPSEGGGSAANLAS